MVSNCNNDFMRGLEHHHLNLKPRHTCHMPCHQFLCYSFVINEHLFLLYLFNFQSFNMLLYFYRMVSNCKNDFMGALEHHHMTLKPHHTCHTIIHVMSFPLSLMNSFNINGTHTQHHGSTITSSYEFATSSHMSHHHTCHVISFFINELL